MPTPRLIRKLIYQLNDHPLVSKAQLSYREVQVKYESGLMEHWLRGPSRFIRNNSWVYHLPDDPGDLFERIEISNQYELNPLEDDYDIKKKFFIVKSEDYHKANFAPARIMVQELIMRLINDGMITPKYPDKVLMDDFVKFRSDNLDRFVRNNRTFVYGSYGSTIPYGIKILEHFVPYGRYGDKRTMQAKWNRPFSLYSAIVYLMKIKHDLTRSTISRHLTHGLIPPAFYRHLFNKFDIKNMVIADPNPGLGSKALASASQECQYHYSAGPFCDCADKLAGFLGVEFNAVKPSDNYDVAILDNFKMQEAEILINIDKWKKKADMVLAYVPRDSVDKIESEYGLIQKDEVETKIHFGTTQRDFFVLI